jgi:hypothetical protein
VSRDFIYSTAPGPIGPSASELLTPGSHLQRSRVETLYSPPTTMSLRSSSARLLVQTTTKCSQRTGVARCRWHTTSNSSPAALSASSWFSSRVGLLAVAIAGTAFAAGFAYNNSVHQDIDYARGNKFTAPKYGSLKEMQMVRTFQHGLGNILNHVNRQSRRLKQRSAKTVSA